MSDLMSVSGRIPEDELVELLDATDDANGGGWIAIVSVIATVSAALQGGCPTSACTGSCRRP